MHYFAFFERNEDIIHNCHLLGTYKQERILKPPPQCDANYCVACKGKLDEAVRYFHTWLSATA